MISSPPLGYCNSVYMKVAPMVLLINIILLENEMFCKSLQVCGREESESAFNLITL